MSWADQEPVERELEAGAELSEVELSVSWAEQDLTERELSQSWTELSWDEGDRVERKLSQLTSFAPRAEPAPKKVEPVTSLAERACSPTISNQN